MQKSYSEGEDTYLLIVIGRGRRIVVLRFDHTLTIVYLLLFDP